MKELRSFSSTVLTDIENYYIQRSIVKKSGKKALNFYEEENSIHFAEMVDELKINIKEMLYQIEVYEIHLDDIYNFRNISSTMLHDALVSSKKTQKKLKNQGDRNNNHELGLVSEDIKSINNKINDLKEWYKAELNATNKNISKIEKLVIESKTILSKVEKRRLVDLRPTHLAIGTVITLLVSLAAGLLINYMYLLPLKGVEPHTFTIIVIVIFSLINILFWVQLVLRHSFGRLYLNDDKPMWKGSLAGFIAAASDTLGIGSFAMATAMFKITKAIKPHELKMLPGTLNVGLAFSQMFAGILFIGAIDVNIYTLILFCGFTVIGTVVGSHIVERLHRKAITFVIATALFATALLMTLVLTNVFPSGTKTGLMAKDDIHLLIIGLVLFFGLGVLMSFGVGLYAPSMVVISLLGLDPITSIPIMTCAAALSQQAAAVRYTIGNNFIPKISLNMTISGILGVLMAFVIVFVLIIGNNKDAQDTLVFIMRCISVVVVLFTAVSLLINFVNMKRDIDAVKMDKNELLSESEFTDKFTHFLSTISKII